MILLAKFAAVTMNFFKFRRAAAVLVNLSPLQLSSWRNPIWLRQQFFC